MKREIWQILPSPKHKKAALADGFETSGKCSGDTTYSVVFKQGTLDEFGSC